MKPTAWISALVLIVMMLGWSGAATVDAGGKQKTATSVATQSEKSNMARLVFEAASQAMLIGEPLAAARLLDHVSTVFPTSAVFNNAGIARAMHAVSLHDKQQPQLIYPWVLDTDLRLEDRETERRSVPKTRGTKWVGEAKDQLIRAVLIRLQKIEDRAHYRPLGINYLSIEGLRGRLGSVLDDAVVTSSIARDEGNARIEALAWTALGVAFGSCNERFRDRGREYLLKAEKLGYELATLNLSLLDGSPPQPAAASTNVDVEMSPEERIENLSPFQARDKFPGKPLGSFQIAGSSRSSLPGVALSRKEHAGTQMVTLRISPVKAKEKAKTYVLLRTLDGYAGQTARGLTLGSRGEDVRQAYGAPSRIIDQLEGQFLIYHAPRIIFEVKDGRLVSWMLYGQLP